MNSSSTDQNTPTSENTCNDNRDARCRDMAFWRKMDEIDEEISRSRAEQKARDARIKKMFSELNDILAGRW